MNRLIAINNLLVCRGGRETLKVDSLDITRGETLAVVGPNGAGKSTLLLALAHLLKPAQGEILFDNKPISTWKDKEYRRKIAVVFQDPLLMDLTVEQNVALGLKFRGVAQFEIKTRVNKWLSSLGIESLAKRRASQLSGGEAQRVSLARAFILDPELLLLDEPFTPLDPPSRGRLLEDLKSVLIETKMTTIFITHDLQEALKLATRMAVILDGRIEQSGDPQNIFDRPINDRVARFLGR